MIPAATVLRQLPGVRLVVGRSEVAHVHATVERARCGWRLPELVDVLHSLSSAAPVRMCGRCLGSLPSADAVVLAPEPAEVAAVHERAARVAAQACIDELARIRRDVAVDGASGHPVQLVRAAPARLPVPVGRKAPTRREWAARDTGYLATAETVSLAQLLNLLTPGGYGPHDRLYLLDPPAPGTRVDPQARR